jgi:rhodanese-related sulfurtransferase
MKMANKLKTVGVSEAAALMKSGALLVDVRESGEFARAHIPGSQHLALSSLDRGELAPAPGQAVVFFCASGMRTATNAGRLAAKAGGAEAYAMEGGLSAWGRAGLPVEAGGNGTPVGTGGLSGFLARLGLR